MADRSALSHATPSVSPPLSCGPSTGPRRHVVVADCPRDGRAMERRSDDGGNRSEDENDEDIPLLAGRRSDAAAMEPAQSHTVSILPAETAAPQKPRGWRMIVPVLTVMLLLACTAVCILLGVLYMNVRSDLNSQQANVAQLRDHADHLQVNVTQVTVAVEQLRNDSAWLHRNTTQLAAAVQQLTAMNDALRAQVTQLTGAVQGLGSSFSLLQSNVSRITATLSQLNATQQVLQASVTQLEAVTEQLRSNSSVLRENVTQIASSAAQLTTNVTQLTADTAAIAATLLTNCTAGPWAAWAACSVTCGVGTTYRTRVILTPAGPLGEWCTDAVELAACTMPTCFPPWSLNNVPSALFFAALQEMPSNSSSNVSYLNVSCPGASAACWNGAVLAPSGLIYAFPFSTTSVLVINPTMRTTGTLNNVVCTSQCYRCGTLATNGLIYSFPYGNGLSILVINPATNLTGTVSVSSYLWSSSAMAANGNIAVIGSSGRVLVFSPSKNETNFLTVSVPGSWNGIVLAPNGVLYAMPTAGTNSILVISALQNSLATITTPPNTGVAGSVLAANGLIYGIPNSGPSVLVFDPTVNSASLISAPLSGNWAGGVLGPNRLIYFLPAQAGFVAVFNPSSNTVQESITVNGSGWTSGVLAPNGRIYCLPAAGGQTPILELLSERPVPMDFVLSRYVNGV